jgi:hypothetical protein
MFPPAHTSPDGQSVFELQDLLQEYSTYELGVGVTATVTVARGVAVTRLVGVGVEDLATVGVGVRVGV